MRIVRWLVLALNVVWFGLGFQLFALRPRKAIHLLVPREASEEKSRTALVEALPFLGGMNLAFAALSGAVLIATALGKPGASWVVFFGSGVAHATQFVCNVPAALRGGRAGGASWDVMRGQMFFIFVVDATCAVANVVALAC
ncbi:MAG: hypothetical protein ACHREM_01245 [Polyangiales bacterium]